MLILFALRNVLRHPWRSLTTAIGVGLGIAAVLATLSIGDNVEANLRSSLKAAAGSSDLLVLPGSGQRAVFAYRDALALASGSADLQEVVPVLNFRAEPSRDLGRAPTSLLPGVDTGFELSGRLTSKTVPIRVVEGTLPAAGSYGIAVPVGFADLRDLELGTAVRFATHVGELSFTVTATLDDGYGYASTNGGRIGIVHLHDLQKGLHLEDRASYLEVHTTSEAVVSQVQQRLGELLEPDFVVTFPAISGNIATGIVETLQSGLTILAVILLAVAGFIAYNTFAATVVERTREYALLRTICLTRKEVRRLALYDAAVVSLLGLALGLLLGTGLAYTITRVNAWSLGFEMRTLVIPLRSVAVASVSGVLISLLAGVLPASKASQTTPLLASNQATHLSSTHPPSPLGLWLLGLATLFGILPWTGLWALVGSAAALGGFFAGISLSAPYLLRPALLILSPVIVRLLGVSGRIGINFTVRNASRNGVAIGIVTVSMGLIIGVGAMVAGINASIKTWIDTTIVGDLFITAPVNFPHGFEKQARDALPAIEAMSGVAVRVVRFRSEAFARGKSISLVLVDPARFDPQTGFGKFQYLPGQGDHSSGHRALTEGERLLAGNTMRERFDLERGSQVELRTDNGFEPFEISGVIVDFTGGGEALIGSLDELPRFGGGTPDLFVATVAEGEDPNSIKRELSSAFPNLHLDISLNQSYRERIVKLTRQTFATTNGLLLLTVLIAALGVTNTLGMNLSERKKEIAVLRALGLKRRGVSLLIITESIVVTIIGCVLGTACGFLLAKTITVGASALTGFPLEAVYPWYLALLSLAGAPLIGVFAATVPARRAARLAPITALGLGE
ncbi:MAG: FtsX-like permease family protein [Trueperaceae bacterium]|nr:MAG: FtsX-like permease family protein [Trueperaceae bacterium]